SGGKDRARTCRRRHHAKLPSPAAPRQLRAEPFSEQGDGLSNIQSPGNQAADSDCQECALFHSLRISNRPLIKKLNGAIGMSDIEGKVTRVGVSERGQRASFKA